MGNSWNKQQGDIILDTLLDGRALPTDFKEEFKKEYYQEWENRYINQNYVPGSNVIELTGNLNEMRRNLLNSLEEKFLNCHPPKLKWNDMMIGEFRAISEKIEVESHAQKKYVNESQKKFFNKQRTKIRSTLETFDGENRCPIASSWCQAYQHNLDFPKISRSKLLDQEDVMVKKKDKMQKKIGKKKIVDVVIEESSESDGEVQKLRGELAQIKEMKNPKTIAERLRDLRKDSVGIEKIPVPVPVPILSKK